MKKLFVSATIMVLCPLAISAAPALGAPKFESEPGTSMIPSSTKLVIPLGTSGSVECSSVELKATLVHGVSNMLTPKLENFTECFYNNNAQEISEITKTVQKCPVELESEGLLEVSGTEFVDGLAETICTLKFEGRSGCTVILEQPSSTIREFQWEDKNSTPGHYESLLEIKLKKISYKFTGSRCGSSGTSGAFDVSIPLKYVIVH